MTHGCVWRGGFGSSRILSLIVSALRAVRKFRCQTAGSVLDRCDGMKVHAWLNDLQLSSVGYLKPAGPPAARLGRGAAGSRRSLNLFPQLGTRPGEKACATSLC